jgi:hypothetical protein
MLTSIYYHHHHCCGRGLAFSSSLPQPFEAQDLLLHTECINIATSAATDIADFKE